MTKGTRDSQKNQVKLLVGDSDQRKAKWAGFVDWEPTIAQKATIRDMKPTAAQVSKMIAELAEHGYKVSFSWVEGEQVINVSLYGRFEDMPNAGHVLSLAHVDPLIALSALHWFNSENCAWGPWIVEDYRASKFDW